nr:hypothetical protein CFP56_00906 [Quercus suber]
MVQQRRYSTIESRHWGPPTGGVDQRALSRVAFVNGKQGAIGAPRDPATCMARRRSEEPWTSTAATDDAGHGIHRVTGCRNYYLLVLHSLDGKQDGFVEILTTSRTARSVCQAPGNVVVRKVKVYVPRCGKSSRGRALAEPSHPAFKLLNDGVPAGNLAWMMMLAADGKPQARGVSVPVRETTLWRGGSSVSVAFNSTLVPSPSWGRSQHLRAKATHRPEARCWRPEESAAHKQTEEATGLTRSGSCLTELLYAHPTSSRGIVHHDSPSRSGYDRASVARPPPFSLVSGLMPESTPPSKVNLPRTVGPQVVPNRLALRADKMPANIADFPPSVIYSWPPANYVDPVQRTWLVPYAAVAQAATTLFIAMRLFLRAKNQAGPLGLDDVSVEIHLYYKTVADMPQLMLIPAFLASSMFTALCIVSAEHYGIGRHIWDVEFDKFEGLALLAWISEIAFLISTSSAKTSVLLSLRRLARGTNAKRWKYAISCAIAFTWCYSSACILALLLSCRPVSAYWRAFNVLYALSGKFSCTDTRVLNPINGCLAVVSDLYSVLLPMAMLWNFECPRRQKIALNLMFSLGLVVVAVGSVRTYYLYQLGYTQDPSWLGMYLYLWSDLEIQLSIICASAPALRVFFRQYVRHSVVSRVVEPTGSNFDDEDITSKSRFSYLEAVKNLPRRMKSTNHRPPVLETSGDAEQLFARQDEKHPESSTTTTPVEPVIKTPEEYEAFALRNLQKNRPPMRVSIARQASEHSVSPASSPLPQSFWDAGEKC